MKLVLVNSTGNTLNSPSDGFETKIIQEKKQVCAVSGSYLSKIEFDSVRYWDIRNDVSLKSFEPKQLKSNSTARQDLILLKQGKIEEAQQAKETLEEIQRADRKLRAK